MKVLVLQAWDLHLGYVSCYGNAWVATPTFDRLAAEGVVFDQHYADCPESGQSPWTGRYRFPFLDTDPSPTGAAASDLSTLLQGQDIPVVHLSPAAAGSTEEEGTALERTLENAVEALDQLAAADRWLLWVELPSLLPPWDVGQEFQACYFTEEDASVAEEEEVAPPLPWLDPPLGPVDREDFEVWERLQLTYATVVTYQDAGLGLLLEELEQRGLLDEILLVVTAARGLALGEHGLVGPYRPWLHEEVIHLPLLVRFPGGAEAGRRIDALTQPVDLFPTLLELFDVQGQPGHGHSLLPLVRGEVEQVRAYACAGLRQDQALEWALRTPAWSLVLPLAGQPEDPPREPQLYVKPEDRWEVNNVRHHRLEQAEHLEEVLRGFAAATRGPDPLEPPLLRDVEAASGPGV